MFKDNWEPIVALGTGLVVAIGFVIRLWHRVSGLEKEQADMEEFQNAVLKKLDEIADDYRKEMAGLRKDESEARQELHSRINKVSQQISKLNGYIEGRTSHHIGSEQ